MFRVGEPFGPDFLHPEHIHAPAAKLAGSRFRNMDVEVEPVCHGSANRPQRPGLVQFPQQLIGAPFACGEFSPQFLCMIVVMG